MCNYTDAGHISDKEKEGKNSKTAGKVHPADLLTANERHKATYMKKLPSFADWAHYMMLVSTCWSGPMVEYSDYTDFIERKEGSNAAKMPRFGNWPAAWKRFAEVWICAGVYAVLNDHVDYK